MKEVFKLFANCIPVYGHTRSIIYDLQRNNYEFIPNGLYEILQMFDGKSIDDVKKNFEFHDYLTIDEYFKFLEQKEYIFYCDESEVTFFPSLDNNWYSSSIVLNAIIDISKMDINQIDYIFKNLENLGCKYYLLKIQIYKSIDFWIQFQSISHKYRIFNIEIYSEYYDSYQSDFFFDFVNKFVLLNKFVLFNAPSFLSKDLSHQKVFFFHENFKENQIEISDTNFNIELSYFIESLNFNSYFNQKIYINSDGYICNMINTNIILGNIFSDAIRSIVISEKFQKLWNSKKDATLICKDCEFRYMCHDSRIPIAKGDEWIHTEECPYNPYIGKWNHEIGYSSVKILS